MSGLLWLALAIVFEIAGTLSLRASDGLRRWRWLIVVAVGYTVALWSLSRSLDAGMHVGAAYAIWVAVGIAAVAILARMLWGDPLNRRMVAGIAVIVLGVALVELG